MLFLSVSCGVQQKIDSSRNEENTVLTPWVSKYPDWTYERRGDYLVFQKTTSPSFVNPLSRLYIVVVDLGLQCEIYQEDVVNASLEWVDDYIFKVNYGQGNPELGKAYFFYYNIATRKKMDRMSPHKL